MNKDKRFVIDSSFIKAALKSKLSLNEFLLLTYFDNAYSLEFDINLITKVLSMDEESVLESYSNLLSKKIITVKAEKNAFGKIVENVSLDNFYNNITLVNKEIEASSSKQDIYSKFEKEFGRTISAMEYEIINGWFDKGFTEELILAALKEAVYNGITNLRYIDKILYEWNRKGYKKASDVTSKDEETEDDPLLETSLMEFDWLDGK